MNPALRHLAVALWTVAFCAVHGEGAPKIQFDRVVYDFGKVAQVDTVSGVFKFTNVGDAVLKVQPPKPSCGCTVAELKPDTLAPGATGELPFTLHLGQVKARFDKHIVVNSNDPGAPEVSLSIQVDYTPLYDLSPLTLLPSLAFGVNTNTQFTTLTRTDGQPLRIIKLDSTQPWLQATVEPGATGDEPTARIRVSIRREGPPRHFNEYIHVYAAEPKDVPVASIHVYGHLQGEVSLSPEALYWSITDPAKPAAERAAELPQRVTVRSADGRAMELKNAQSTIKGLSVELVPREAGKVYELVARLDQVPASTVSGSVSFETSVASQPRIEVPVIVNVFKP